MEGMSSESMQKLFESIMLVLYGGSRRSWYSNCVKAGNGIQMVAKDLLINALMFPFYSISTTLCSSEATLTGCSLKTQFVN